MLPVVDFDPAINAVSHHSALVHPDRLGLLPIDNFFITFDGFITVGKCLGWNGDTGTILASCPKNGLMSVNVS